MKPISHCLYCVLLFSLLSFSTTAAEPLKTSRIKLIGHTGESLSLHVWVANTHEARRMGMMHRSSWGEMDGMWFDFLESRYVSMWMKDTPLAMDMLFVDAACVIVQIFENTIPFSTHGYPSSDPIRFVLEVPDGFVRQHAIETGDRFTCVSASS